MAKATVSATPQEMISSLVEISKLDTLYRDLFFQRALELMDTVLSQDAYMNVKASAASLGMREQQLRGAIERGEWKKTAELTERVRRIRESVARASQSMQLAEA